MPAWSEQQQQINAVRSQQKQAADRLYEAQIKLRQTSLLLDRAKKNETNLAANEQQVAALQSQIAQLQQQLKDMNAELSAIENYFDKIRQNDEYISFLQKKIETVTAQINELTEKRNEEENSGHPDKKIIDNLSKQIYYLQKLLAELQKNLEAAKDVQQKLKHDQQEEGAKQQQLQNSANGIKKETQRLQEDLVELLQQNNQQDIEQLIVTQKDQHAVYEKTKGEVSLLNDKLSVLIGSLYVDPHPRNGIENLNDNIPFLLLPVRMETRFISERNVHQLWLRIYPDDIAIHTHEKLLTQNELKDGIAYWKLIFDVEKNGGADKETAKKSAWNIIATTYGGQRAAYVSLQTKPKNWVDLAVIQSADELIFPEIDLTKPDAWSRAPRVNILPDRFIVTLYEGGAVVKEVVGNLIPDELFVGPDPLDVDASFVTKDERLLPGENFNWTSDFDKAINYGMGFKIPLTQRQAANGFEKIVALGVFLSSDESASQKMVEELIDNHHYSPKGFSIVSQGTPTNNTDENGSGYTKNDAFSNVSYVTDAGDPLFTEADECDGKNLADALGIDYAPLQNILHSDGKDYAEAVEMNTALYPSTLGFYFDTMLSPVLDEATQNKLRDFYISHVTGRGPLPPIRVGNQPYGVLLTSNFDTWKLPLRQNVLVNFGDDNFLDGLYKILKHYNDIWNSLLGEVAFVGKNGADASKILMDIIGLQPNTASLYQRIAYSTDYLRNLDDFKYNGRYHEDMEKNFTAKNSTLGVLQNLGYTITDIPQLLRLVYQHYYTTLDAANIIDDNPLSEKNGIAYYDEAAKKNYFDWLAAINDSDTLEKQNFGVGKPVPTALLYMQLRRSLSLQLHKSAVAWLSRYDYPVGFTLEAKNFHNIRPAGDLTKWEVLKAPLSTVDINHSQKDKTISQYLLGKGKNENEAAFLNNMKQSITLLAGLPTARLERCFMEHIDTCNYRLDAWQTGMFHLRLLQQRNTNAENRNKGIYIGAYSCLENIKPSSTQKIVADNVPEKLQPKNKELIEYTDNGGFVHAPSLNHASAAAVLRSGYMSHATRENPEVMAVNLSSERVRRAMFVLDGMRNGQTLEALLGYQFERGLHDRGSADNSLLKLNLYIYDFRDAFPLQYHSIQQEGSDTTIESVPANNVVNGVTLAEYANAFPYGAKGNVFSASAAERDAIIQEKDKLSDTLDAVKDLLTAESVYQLVQGNFERCGALINALKDAIIPQDIDVVNTPRGSNFSFTNRVVVNFGNVEALMSANNPWSAISMTPRAIMEPGINKWLGKILGDPAKLVFTVLYLDENNAEQGKTVMSVEDLNIQPIDLIYGTGNNLNTGAGDNNSVSELENRIAYQYKRNNGIDDSLTMKIQFTQPENVAGKENMSVILPLITNLRSVITNSRYMHAKDFDPDSKKSLVDKNNPKAFDDAELLSRVLQLQSSFNAQVNSINTLPMHAEIPDPDAGNAIVFYNNLKDAFAALDKVKLAFADVSVIFANTDAEQLLQLLINISNFGVPDAFPKQSSGVTTVEKNLLLEQARSVVRRIASIDKSVTDIINAASPLTDIEKKIIAYIQAGKLILQESFNILPMFGFNNDADVQLSQNDSAQLLKFATTQIKMNFPADEWMENAAHVRPGLSRLEQVKSFYELRENDYLESNVMQLPYRAKDSWVAVEFPEKDEITGGPFGIVHDTLSVITHGEKYNAASKQSGILIDDWTELIPANEELTGISFNYNQPNAMAPQALLLAVTPEIKGHWTWDDLLGIVNDTLHRAKLRAVEPQLLDKLNLPEVNVLRPSLLADFTDYDLNIALDYRMNIYALAEIAPVKYVLATNN